MGILDTAGYYYLMGGDLALSDDESTYGNDVWRSTFSFHDLPAVANNCKLSQPAAVGLRCWPGNDGCSAASSGGSSSASSGLSAAGIVGIVAAVLVVAVVGFFGWRYWQRRQAQMAGVLLGGTAMGSDAFLGTDRL